MEENDFMEVLSEGWDDLVDARQLAAHGGDAASMALYHARQAVEKFLRALAMSKAIKINITWGLPDLWAALDESDAELQQSVEALSVKDEDAESDHLSERIEAAVKLMDFVYGALGVQHEDLPEIKPVPRAGTSRKKIAPRRDTRRRKRFYMCPRCGVNIPFTHQTARGRVICPHCGGLMRLVS